VPYKGGYLISRGNFSYIKNNSETFLKLEHVRDFIVYKDTLYYASPYEIGYLSLITAGESESKTILPKAGKSVTIDSVSGKIYFATIDGIVEYRNQYKKHLKNNNQRITASKIQFYNNELWVNSFQDGLRRIKNGIMDTSEIIQQKIKGKNIKTFHILNNKLFITTELCLNIISLTNNEVEYYNFSEGLLSKEVNDLIVTENNFIYLATNKGLVKFKSSEDEKANNAPNIFISGFIGNHQNFSATDSKVELPYSTQRISIAFVTACPESRGQHYFKYRLLPIDSSYSNLNAYTNEITLSSIAPGNYCFEIFAVNEKGSMSKRSAVFYFSIAKPFWHKWWFYIAVGLMGAGLVSALSMLIIKNIKNKSKIKNELTQSQLTAIRAQMNPHFMYNTLGSIQDLILKADVKNTNYYLSKFSNLMRTILEFSENEKISLKEETDMLFNYLELEKLRFGDTFNFHVDICINKDLSKIFIPSLIIQPFVENAIKHGLLHKKGQKTLHVKFNQINNQLVISIEDNGIGRHHSEQIKSRNNLNHKSFATSAVKKRLQLLNLGKTNKIDLEIIDVNENEKAAGTKVVIKISGSFS